MPYLKHLSSLFAFLLFFSFLLIFSSTCRADIYVDDDWSSATAGQLVDFPGGPTGIEFGVLAFGTIQEAVEAASDGETVFIAAGTYNAGHILIDKGLTISGAGAGQTIIDGQKVDPISYFGVFQVTSTTGTPVVISDLAIINPGIYNDPVFGSQSCAIFAGSSCASPVEIRDCAFTGHDDATQNLGVYFSLCPESVSIIITGSDFSLLWKSVIIESCLGATTISGNSFHDLSPRPVGPSSYPALGVWIQTFSDRDITNPVDVSDNSITGTFGYGISFRTSNGSSYSGVSVTGNTIEASGSTDDCSGIAFQNSASDEDEAENGGIRGAIISGNDISSTGPNLYAVGLVGNNPGLVIEENTIDSVGTAFAIGEYPEGTGITTDLTVVHNSIENASVVFYNPSEVEVEASGNWWGTDDPDEIAELVGSGVSYSPWMTDSPQPAGVPETYSIVPETSFSSVVSFLEEGDTIYLSAGTYEESLVIEVDNVTVLGEGCDCVFISLTDGSSGVIVNADGVTLRGFSVVNTRDLDNNGATVIVGISILSAGSLTIRDMCIEGNEVGIHATSSSSNVCIELNTITSNQIGVLVEGTDIKMYGNKIINDLAGTGVQIAANATAVLKYNTITGNSGDGGVGVLSESSSTIHATENSWGDSSGPKTTQNQNGNGHEVSGNVSCDPWIGKENSIIHGATILSLRGKALSADETDTISDADYGVSAEVSATGDSDIVIARYASNPMSKSMSKYEHARHFDVYLSNPTAIDALKCRFYYSAETCYGADEAPLYCYLNGKWRVVEGQVNVEGSFLLDGKTYGGYIEFEVTEQTSPAISDLTGTVFAVGSDLVESTGGGGCFIATAAFGSYSASAVTALTSCRDNALANSFCGRNLVELYYSISPEAAHVLSTSSSAQLLIRRILLSQM